MGRGLRAGHDPLSDLEFHKRAPVLREAHAGSAAPDHGGRFQRCGRPAWKDGVLAVLASAELSVSAPMYLSRFTIVLTACETTTISLLLLHRITARCICVRYDARRAAARGTLTRRRRHAFASHVLGHNNDPARVTHCWPLGPCSFTTTTSPPNGYPDPDFAQEPEPRPEGVFTTR